MITTNKNKIIEGKTIILTFFIVRSWKDFGDVEDDIETSRLAESKWMNVG